MISKIEGLAPLVNLEDLVLSQNRLATVEDLAGVLEVPQIIQLDI
jgi:hypothetical protein